MTLYLRLATEADLERIMQLETASFPSDAWPEESMRFELNGPHTSYFVAFDAPEEQNLIGYGGIANALYELPQTAMVFGDAKLALKSSVDNKGQVLIKVLLLLTSPHKADPQRPTL